MDTIRSEMIGKHDRTDGCQCDSCGSLTFAEAMALDPSEVEFCPTPPGKRANHWWPFDTWRQYGHMDMRDGSWRRARPKRSRVQEMVEEVAEKGAGFVPAGWMDYAIRGVCEWIRDQGFDSEHRDGDYIATKVARHFLEPR